MAGEEGVRRRLAAILAADVAGYSRLMEADEEGTLVALTAHRAALIDPAIATHRGRLVKTTGDGLLAEFASVVDAMRCALAIQSGMQGRNAGVNEDRRIVLRIGVNLGDVIVQDGDIFGDGVNVAARLEQMAEPGGVCVAANVFDQVEGRLDVVFEDRGEQILKNIAKPVRVYALAADAPAEVRASAPPPPERPSIAVLPFQNMSGDPEQEYFADGISEDIITDLSKLSGMLVIARNSSFVYKGKSVGVRQIGRDLGVRCVLEGSVRKAGNRVRITAQLIDTGDDSHLWAERYDRALDDIFAVQEEVAREVVTALRVTLNSAEQKAMAERRQTDIEIYDLLLRARQFAYLFTPEANSEARRLLETVIARDPGNAEAMARLADTYLYVWNQGWSLDPAETLVPAATISRKAVELDPDLAAGHESLAHVAVWQRQYDLAITEIEHANRLDPNSVRGKIVQAMIMTWSGRPGDAVPAAEAALRLDPNSRTVALWALGQALYHLGRYADAEAKLHESALLNPAFMPAQVYLCAARMRQGKTAEAKAALARATGTAAGLATVARLADFLPYRDPKEAQMLLDDLRKTGLLEG